MDFTRKHRDLIIHEVLSVNDIQVLQEEREEQLIQEGSLLAFLKLNGLRQERLISISTILVLMIVQKNCKQKRKMRFIYIYNYEFHSSFAGKGSVQRRKILEAIYESALAIIIKIPNSNGLASFITPINKILVV